MGHGIETPPNVVLVIADDLTYGDLGCYGNTWSRTPHLDGLHGSSTRLERYCSGPLCTPARASLMTGRYPFRTRAIDTYCGRSMVDPDEVTLAQVLQNAGYATCLSGKWHLGDCHPMRPIDLGFDESLMHNGGGLHQPNNPWHWDDPPGDGYVDPMLSRNGVFERVRGYCTDIFAEHTIGFIEAHRDRPFFTYLATNAPHTPCVCPDEWADRYRELGFDDDTAQLYGMVDNLDHNVGRVLETLERLDLADQTIVIFTSDHGAQPVSHRLPPGHPNRLRFNAGLRGGKGTMYDGGIRTPCFWRWPGRFAPGRAVTRVANPIDYLPTVASACGAAVPTDRVIDGVDLIPVLDGSVSEAEWPERVCFMHWHRGDEPVRGRNAAVVGDRWKWYRPREDAPPELYDTAADPGESRDLAPEEAGRVAAMGDLYDAWFDEVCRTRPDNFAPPRIRIGTPHEPRTMLSRTDWRVEGEDGWSDAHAGRWHVTFATEGTYSAEVLFTPGPSAGRVRLTIGSATFESEAPGGCSSVVFEGLAVAAGDAKIGAEVEREEERLSARLVAIERDA
ncbi:MAG: arylsulfatase [Planctomycetota bacterium]